MAGMSRLDYLLARISPEPNSGCWLWLGYLHPAGYGRIVNPDGTTTGAHRAIYEELVRLIPDGLQLDHLCRVRCCVNPQHLEPVTCGENIRRGETGKNNGDKTHCKYGHEYTPANTVISKDGRSCRTCRNLAQLRCTAREKAAVIG